MIPIIKGLQLWRRFIAVEVSEFLLPLCMLRRLKDKLTTVADITRSVTL